MSDRRLFHFGLSASGHWIGIDTLDYLSTDCFRIQIIHKLLEMLKMPSTAIKVLYSIINLWICSSILSSTKQTITKERNKKKKEKKRKRR